MTRAGDITRAILADLPANPVMEQIGPVVLRHLEAALPEPEPDAETESVSPSPVLLEFLKATERATEPVRWLHEGCRDQDCIWRSYAAARDALRRELGMEEAK